MENTLSLEEFLEKRKKMMDAFDTLPITAQIEMLKQNHNSVFTAHMEDGRKVVRGDESNKKEMKKFFKKYPPTGVKWVEFHK